MYKCEEKGEVVAIDVLEEVIPDFTNPDDGLISKQRKELRLFERFAEAARLQVDEDTAANRNPPLPDIFCKILGKPRWFELGEIINTDVGEKVNPKRKRRDPGFSINQGEAFFRIVEKKRSRKYKTNGESVDLLLHFDLRFGAGPVALFLIKEHVTALTSLINEGPFQTIWIYDDHMKAVLQTFHK
jgi:hypothetical protein